MLNARYRASGVGLETAMTVMVLWWEGATAATMLASQHKQPELSIRCFNHHEAHLNTRQRLDFITCAYHSPRIQSLRTTSRQIIEHCHNDLWYYMQQQ
jgi:hypothetical protein